MSVDAMVQVEHVGTIGLPVEMDGDTYGGAVARVLDVLDETCVRNRVAPIRSFVVDDYELDGAERALESGPWFDPEAVLQTIESLLDHVRGVEDDSSLGSSNSLITASPRAVEWDLRAFRLIMLEAVANGRRCRILLF